MNKTRIKSSSGDWSAVPGRSSSRVLSVLVLASPGHVRFIDYEYSSYNYQAFDIGNHFNEFAGLPNLAADFFVVKKKKKKKKTQSGGGLVSPPARVCAAGHSGMTEPDFGLYPGRDMQMDWLRVYLQAFKLFTKNSEEEVSQRELETLYVQVNKFALVRTNPPPPPPSYLPTLCSLCCLPKLAASHISLLCCLSHQASHFFWGFWALIQAKYSSIDFDFLG